MVVLVVLRLSLGFHFLYEGVWKIKHPEFSAEPFLTQAKGPLAPLFYAMIPDINGRERLRIEVDEKGNKTISGKYYLDAWKDLGEKVKQKYRLDNDQKAQVDAIYHHYEKAVTSFLADNLDEIEAYFGSLDRFEKELKEPNGAAYQQKRDWDRRQELRQEVNVWLTGLGKSGKSYQAALWNVLKPDQQAEGALPVGWTQSDLLNFAVTYGLTAIGLCLLVGFCTRLAALGGAAFMFSVLLTQPPWPSIYPPAPEVVGHALIVDKNFVEMVALLLMAVTAVGRWGGLDFFLYRFLGRPLENWWKEKYGHAIWSMNDYADEIAMLALSNKPEDQFGLLAAEKEIRKLGAEISKRWGSNGMRQVWNLIKTHPRFGVHGEVAATALTRLWDGIGEWKC